MKTRFGLSVKRIRFDNGGEAKSKYLLNFIERNGIQMEYTISHSPQMNGRCERMNGILLSKLRTKLIDSGVPKFLWGEALKCTVYETNRSPTSVLPKGKTPSELWNGRNDLSKLKIFGCRAWHTLTPKPGKLEPRAVRAVMVGYCGGGYRLWLPQQRKIIKSRDVRFDESIMEYKDKNANENNSQESVEPMQVNNPVITIDEENTLVETDEDSEHVVENNVQESFTDTNAQEEIITTKRRNKKPGYLDDYELYTAYCFLSSTDEEPKTFEQAIESEEWKVAIKSELESHEKLKTWTPAKLPEGTKAIETRWVFKIKEDGTKKARLVARGFQVPQEEWEFFYAPVCRIPTVRLLLSVAVQRNWILTQIDVPTAFLNGDLDSEVYIKTPKGVESQESTLVLNRSLYGLPSAPKCWNNKFSNVMKNLGFNRSDYDYCLYYKDNIYIVLFVDDAILAGTEENVNSLLVALQKNFNIKNLGCPRSFLGMEIKPIRNGLHLSQTKMIERLLKEFGMEVCRAISTPMEVNFKVDESQDIIRDVPFRRLICSLMYLSITTRPDIAFSVSYLSRYLDKPTSQTWKAGLRVLRYLNFSKDLGLPIIKSKGGLEGMSDADWGADQNDSRRSVSGFVCFHAGNPITWYSKKQRCVAQSTMEAEYIAAGFAAQELVNLRGVLSDLSQVNRPSSEMISENLLKSVNDELNEKTQEIDEMKAILKIDNASAISLANTFSNTKRGKHIEIKFHFIKHLCLNNVIKIEYVSSKNNIADLFTKSLGAEKFQSFRNYWLIN